jgi:hypothetical protein
MKKLKNIRNILLYHDSTSTEFFFGIMAILSTLNTIIIDKDYYYIIIIFFSIIHLYIVSSLNLLHRNRMNILMVIVFTSFYIYEKIYGVVDANKEGLYICILVYVWAWVRTQSELYSK